MVSREFEEEEGFLAPKTPLGMTHQASLLLGAKTTKVQLSAVRTKIEETTEATGDALGEKFVDCAEGLIDGDV